MSEEEKEEIEETLKEVKHEVKEKVKGILSGRVKEGAKGEAAIRLTIRMRAAVPIENTGRRGEEIELGDKIMVKVWNTGVDLDLGHEMES